MKLAAIERDVSSSGIQQQSNFRIKASAKAFKILSDGLYANKIGAIVREISTNAWDANPRGVPIKIHIPTILNPTFIVTDEGPGLSHDDVVQVYTTYFESTKTDSNDAIGCLGLGSKAPFSYVDQYTVVSRHGGMERTYSCYLDASGMPSVALLSEKPTNNPTGLEVRVPVKDRDHQRFRDECRNQLRFFSPRPEFSTPIDFNDPKVELQGPDYEVYTRDTHTRSNWTVVQGVVGYPLSWTELSSYLGEKALAVASEMRGVLRVPVGSVDIAASREALGYDEQTVKYLTRRFESVSQHFMQHMRDGIEQAPTLWDAICKLSAIRQSMPYSMKKLLDDAKYKGADVDSSFKVTTKYPCGWIDKGWFNRKHKRSPTTSHEIMLYPEREIVIFIDDTQVRKTARIEKYFDENPQKTAVIIHGDDLQRFPEGYPIGTPIKLSEIEPPPSAPRYNYKAFRQMLGVDRSRVHQDNFDGTNSVDRCTFKLDENPEEGFYVVTHANCTYDCSGLALQAKYVLPGKVFLIQKSAENKIKKLPELKPFLPEFKKALAQMVKEQDIIDRVQRHEAYWKLDDHLRQAVRKAIAPQKRSTRAFWKLYRSLEGYKEIQITDLEQRTYDLYLTLFKPKLSDFHERFVLKAKKKFMSACPLLNMVLEKVVYKVETEDLTTVINQLS